MNSIIKFLLFICVTILLGSCEAPKKELDPSVLEYLISNGITVIPIEGNSQKLKVNLSRQTNLSAEKIEKLDKIKDQLVELNLSNSNFTNSLVSSIGMFSNLETLNLSDTKISDSALSTISKLSNLKKLNLANTKVSADRVAKLMDEIPGIDIEQGESNDSISKLSAPNIETASEIFSDNLSVKILSSVKNAKIHYTLDGTDPTENSPIYSSPIALNKTTTVKAAAVKTPGKIGLIGEKKLIQTKVKVKKVSLESPPSEKYKASGPSSLVDHLRGGSNFSTQFWTGYQGKNLVANLDLEKEYEISQVNVSALSDPNNWIHYPKGIKVWSGATQSEMKLVKEIFFKELDGSDPIEAKYFSTSFDPIKTKHLKIEVMSQIQNPIWHPSKGEPCWIFVDEIIVE